MIEPPDLATEERGDYWKREQEYQSEQRAKAEARARELEAQLAGVARMLDGTAEYLARNKFAATAEHLRESAAALRVALGSHQQATAPKRCAHGHESPPDCAYCLAFPEPPAAEPLEWHCAKCGAVEPVEKPSPDAAEEECYGEGDCEPCITCNDGCAKVRQKGS